MKTLSYWFVVFCILAMGTTASAQSKFSCGDWMTLPQEQKQPLIEAFIAQAKKDKVIMCLPAAYYVKELDALIKTYDDAQRQSSLGATIHTIAAMEGDWGNGEDKLEHAKKWMGPNFEIFKEKYPDKYQKLILPSAK
jgi:hypothetical protein